MEHERKEMLKQEQEGLDQPEDPDFSASYYGPVFDSEPPEDSEIADVVEPEKKHGYIYVHETHDNHDEYPNLDNKYCKMIRYFILTFKDSKGRVMLHNACRFGDK